MTVPPAFVLLFVLSLALNVGLLVAHADARTALRDTRASLRHTRAAWASHMATEHPLRNPLNERLNRL